MTPEEIKLSVEHHLELISKSRQAIRESNSALYELREKCPHSFRELSQEESLDEFMSVGADCLICKSDYGWRCKESPDGVCHYYDFCEDSIELINGKTIPLPEGYEPDLDCCIFCGMPEERK